MILYFSGTGNSQFAAEQVAQQLGERAFSIEGNDLPTTLSEGESLGLVFPVYAWGLPYIVETFILQRLCAFRGKTHYLWALITCGDDIGYADRFLQKTLLQGLGVKADAIFSVQMTETYICLPGFDVDTPEVSRTKVGKALLTLQSFVPDIKAKRNVLRVYRGPIPHIYTYILRPIFRRWLMTDRYFHVDASACSHCGRCAKQCPAQDIKMTDGIPTWQSDACITCLRCFHHCPTRAIDWGRFTKGKNQKPAITNSTFTS